MMLAALSCDPTFPFNGLCQLINGHDPTGVAGAVVVHAIASVGIFLVVYIAGRVIRRAADATMHRSGTDVQVRTLFHNVITVATYTAAVLSAIVVAGVNVAVMLTAAGVSTVAIGLAFQDILRNILAGIWLLLERPFRLGDNITVADQSGTVQDIQLRTTTLRTGDGRLAVLPNLTAFSNPVINATTYSLRQFTVGVRLDDPADLASAIRAARGALSDVTALADRPEASVRPQLDGEHAVLHCTYWIDQTEHNADAVAADVAQRVWTAVGQRRASGT